MRPTHSLLRAAALATAFTAFTACTAGGGGSPGGSGGSSSGSSGSGSSSSSSGGSSSSGAGGGSGGGGAWPDLVPPSAPEHAPPAPVNTGAPTRGGTLTFTSIGAPGWWGRVVEKPVGDPACNVESRNIPLPWGDMACCRTRHEVTSNRLTPFNEQQTLVLDGPMRVRQLAVYQPLQDGSGSWAIRSFWDRRDAGHPFNLHFSGPDDARAFSGDLGNNCSFFAMQARPFPCGPGSDPYCPVSALSYDGWAGSKLFVVLASMPYAEDAALRPLSCLADGQDEKAEDSPWIGLSASELDRDGWSGYSPCHCFANTDGGVGDGCGQINVFEVIAESSGSRWGNRDMVSTGIRSYQVGSLGGVTCGIQGCTMDHFAADADLLDANGLRAMTHGAAIDADHRASAEGPMWRRARDDRYYVFLLDEGARTVQVAVLHPGNLPAAIHALLPALPNEVPGTAIDALLDLSLPQ